ncbi:MAG: hypothetical protein IJO20_00055 [Ruminococcus sp.]|nr:hypothetical protein [Ruminococcus sp.]
MLERLVCRKLSQKLYLVYFLNVLDWVCTVMLLKTGLFYEANPIANTFIHSILLGFVIKCVAPFAVVFLIVRSMNILEISQLKTADMMISFALTVYLAVTLDHVINFFIYLF